MGRPWNSGHVWSASGQTTRSRQSGRCAHSDRPVSGGDHQLAPWGCHRILDLEPASSAPKWTSQGWRSIAPRDQRDRPDVTEGTEALNRKGLKLAPPGTESLEAWMLATTEERTESRVKNEAPVRAFPAEAWVLGRSPQRTPGSPGPGPERRKAGLHLSREHG